jgi:hypothetical protein
VTELTEPVPEQIKLIVSPQRKQIQVADDLRRPTQAAVVLRWWQQEPDQRQVEPARESEQLLGVELTAAFPGERALDRGHRRLPQPGPEERFEPDRGFFLGPAA